MEKRSAILLPVGLKDQLPWEAEQEAKVVSELMGFFTLSGYERVKPPLLEFEESLFSGPGAHLQSKMFRIPDSLSQKQMALRIDMTVQTARLASTGLGQRHRPLRLCYAGEVLRIEGSDLRPERQFTQVGFELLGAPKSTRLAADAEVILLAVKACSDLGVEKLSVDLSWPLLIPEFVSVLYQDHEQRGTLLNALEHKDAGTIRDSGGEYASFFLSILQSVGLIEEAQTELEALIPPEQIKGKYQDFLEELSSMKAHLQEKQPDLTLTLDLLEHKGFGYQQGLAFTFYAPQSRGELGRGGRYEITAPSGKTETATGYTFYLDSLLQAVQPLKVQQRLLVSYLTSKSEIERLQQEGWATVNPLEKVKVEELEEKARGMNCHAYLKDKTIVRL